MSHRPVLQSALQSRRIALPESRQLDVLADLFERRQATVLRVPLVSIHDTPDQATVARWLREFVRQPPDLLIALTGEGLRRLRSAAERQELEAQFLAALANTPVLCRGPKPGRALREMGLAASLQAEQPTTAGVITTLAGMELAGKRVAVQLYGEDPNLVLMSHLAERNLAACLPVAPYVYGDDSDTAAVLDLITRLAAGELDMIAFTSKPQVKRLLAVASAHEQLAALRFGMAKTLVAAVGPVVADELARAGVEVGVMPDSSYFMKPLVRAAEEAFAAQGARR